MSNFTIQDYKEMCEMLTRERDYEHTRFLREQIKRSELQQEIDMLNEKLEIMSKFKNELREMIKAERAKDEDEDSDEDVVLSGDIVDFHRMKNDTKQL